MNKPLALLSLTLLAAPLMLAQTPAPPAPDSGPTTPPPPGMNAPDHGPMHFRGDRPMHHFEDRSMREHDRGPRMMRDRGEMRFGRGPEGLPGLRVPPGTWWRNSELVSRIGLSPDQVKKIDGIFLDARVQLIHTHATLEEEQVRLEPLLSANPINQQAAEAQVAKIADTRAELEKANAKMLLTIRGVLTADQWTKLSDRHDFFRGPGPDGPGPRAIAPHGTHRSLPNTSNPPTPPAE
jgi:Spy/CpxP family protein refolding chaperone